MERGHTDYEPVQKVITTLFEAVIPILNWIIVLIPLAVFGIVSRIAALKGFEPFKALGGLDRGIYVFFGRASCRGYAKGGKLEFF